MVFSLWIWIILLSLYEHWSSYLNLMENQNRFWQALAERRWKTLVVDIGGVSLGGGYPIRIQSMTNTDTMDTDASLDQCIRIIQAGAEYVRLTTRSIQEAENLENIKRLLRRKGYTIPLIADVHFNARIALTAAQIVEKVRINPGNFLGTKDDNLENIREELLPLLSLCKKYRTALRIGVNHGSLSSRIMESYGDTPEGMVASAMEYLKICRDEGFHRLVVSLKTSNTRVLVHANRLLVWRMMEHDMHYPIHLGLTEAGEGEDGRIRSAAAIGSLLADGIGDTIRVSLTEDPEEEIPVARKILLFSQPKGKEDFVGENVAIMPFEYQRRRSQPVDIVGGIHPPVVISGARLHETASSQKVEPDMVFAEKILPGIKFKQIVPYNKAIAAGEIPENVFPLCKPDEHPRKASGLVFIQINLGREQANLPIIKNTVLVLSLNPGFSLASIRAFFAMMERTGNLSPLVLKIRYPEEKKEDFSLRAACELGPVLLDGLADGVWLEGPPALEVHDEVSTAFNLLQATRMRMFKTEFISCPSCGRALFNILDTVRRVKEKTVHLQGIRIAIMGCLVNGPGEMADADYGYVGAAPGKITLYRGKEPVKKNIPAERAVEELIALISQDGKWIERK
jgi:(E)-4-hydroxy-3-methylbut-2-enyl-diphosphate synthase